MKYSALDVVIACGDPRLSTTQKQILQAVALHSTGTEGLCWAGEETIAALANVTTRTVERNLPELVAGGWLVFVGRHPTWGTDTYRIAAEAIAESLRRKDAHVKAVQEATRARRAARLHEQAAKIAGQLAALGAGAPALTDATRHGVGSGRTDTVSERPDMVSDPIRHGVGPGTDIGSGNPIRDPITEAEPPNPPRAGGVDPRVRKVSNRCLEDLAVCGRPPAEQDELARSWLEPTSAHVDGVLGMTRKGVKGGKRAWPGAPPNLRAREVTRALQDAGARWLAGERPTPPGVQLPMPDELSASSSWDELDAVAREPFRAQAREDLADMLRLLDDPALGEDLVDEAAADRWRQSVSHETARGVPRGTPHAGVS